MERPVVKMPYEGNAKTIFEALSRGLTVFEC